MTYPFVVTEPVPTLSGSKQGILDAENIRVIVVGMPVTHGALRYQWCADWLGYAQSRS